MVKRLRQIPLDTYKPLRDVVIENIREAILKGDFPAGMRLMESHLAAELGVSRTPIREAIRNLEQEGLVVMIPRRGAYVADISIQDINEVYEIRSALEALAAGLAAERIEKPEIEEMDRYLLAMKDAVNKLDYQRIVELDTQFHDVIYRASRNKRCMNIINTLRQQITSIRARSLPYPGRLDEMLLEHRAIVDAIAQRDVEKAQRAVTTHMENAERTVLRIIEEQFKAQGKPPRNEGKEEKIWQEENDSNVSLP